MFQMQHTETHTFIIIPLICHYFTLGLLSGVSICLLHRCESYWKMLHIFAWQAETQALLQGGQYRETEALLQGGQYRETEALLQGGQYRETRALLQG